MPRARLPLLLLAVAFFPACAALVGISEIDVADAGAADATRPDDAAVERDGAPDAGGVPLHVETWAFDDDCSGARGASPDLVRSWVTYAVSQCRPSASAASVNRPLNDCRDGPTRFCKAIVFLDANIVWQNTTAFFPLLTTEASENWWIHQAGFSDSAHRIVWTHPSWGTGYLLDQALPAVQAWIATYARDHFDGWDALLLGDTSAGLAQQLYGSGSPPYTTCQEMTTDAELQAAHRALAGGMTHRDGSPISLVYTPTQPNPNVVKPWPLVAGSVHGVVEAEALWFNGALSAYYSSLLDDIALVATQYPAGTFLVLSSSDQNAPPQGRRIHTATAWLGYEPGHLVSDANLGRASGDLATWPEQGIVPTRPIQSMSAPAGDGCMAGRGAVCTVGGHNDLRVTAGTSAQDAAAGVYVREFAACFNRGVAIGPCAAIMNDTANAVTVLASWLKQSYGHAIAFQGETVQSGGSIDLVSAPFAAGASIAPNDALLVVR